MTAIKHRSILSKKCTCTSCLDSSNNGADAITCVNTQQDVDMVFIASNFVNQDSHRKTSRLNKNKHIAKSLSREYALSKLGNKYNVNVDSENTVTFTSVTKISSIHYELLDKLKRIAHKEVKKMLFDRTLSSSKHFKELPCVISKSLIAKYQKNKKCKSVSNLVLPISGDNGRQIKVSEDFSGIRVPSLFKKETIPVSFKSTPDKVRCVEIFKRKREWFMSVSYDISVKKGLTFSSIMGIDRNVRGNVVTCADSFGKVRKIGQDVYSIKKNFKRRVAKLQSNGKKQMCKKLSGKQKRITKDINHKVSHAVVQLAKSTSSAIVLENLSTVRKGKSKIKGFVEKSQWAYHQLDTFIRYKAALHCIPVFYVSPRNTSKMCSKCGTIGSPKGKQFECINCGHFDHRDVNAAFNIRDRFKHHCDSTVSPSVSYGRRIGKSQTTQCLVV